MLPSPEQATQFATMLYSGLAPGAAILYFVESDDLGELAILAKKWASCRAVRKATVELMGGPWEKKSVEEKAKLALEIQRSQMATLMASVNYAEADAGMKAKLDTSRVALETFLAGTAGKGDALSQFFDDIRTGRVKVANPPGSVMSGRIN